MEAVQNITVMTAYFVTKDAITPTSAFTIPVAGSYYNSTSDKTYYMTAKGWKEEVTYSWESKEVAYTEDEAKELKKAKTIAYIGALKSSVEANAKTIADLEASL